MTYFIILVLTMLFFAVLGYKKPVVALVTLPIVCIALGVIAVDNESPEWLIFIAFIFLLGLIAIALSESEPDFERLPQQIARWTLLTIVFLLAVITGFAVFGGWGILVLFGICVLAATLIGYGLSSRYATAAYILTTIGASMRQNLPLPMALETAAQGQKDIRARTLRRIKKWLVQGYSLSESLKRGYPKCPGYAVAMITAAERINQLPFAFKALEADIVEKADERKRIRPVHPFYPVLVITVITTMVILMAKFVVPTYLTVIKENFEGAELPAVTQFLMKIISPIFWQSAIFWIVLGLIILISIPAAIRIRFRPRRPEKPYMISRLFDFIKWHLPVLHWFENNYSIVQAIEILRLSLNAGVTVNQAIANTIGLDVNNCFKKRLRNWLEKVEAGENISAAARESKLGSTIAWAFDADVNQGNTLTILEMLEEFYRSNYSYRVNLARFILWPCVTIMLGLIVGFVVYAFFSPMVYIINHLADMVTP